MPAWGGAPAAQPQEEVPKPEFPRPVGPAPGVPQVSKPAVSPISQSAGRTPSWPGPVRVKPCNDQVLSLSAIPNAPSPIAVGRWWPSDSLTVRRLDARLVRQPSGTPTFRRRLCIYRVIATPGGIRESATFFQRRAAKEFSKVSSPTLTYTRS